VVRLLRRALESHPDDFWGNFRLAEEYAQTRPPRWPEAVPYYRAALALRPRNPGVLLNFSSALKETGDLPGAAALLRRALALEPDFAWAHCNLGTVLHAQMDLPGAVAAYRTALRLDPRDARSHANLAVALHEQGDWPGARAAFREALRLGPDRALFHSNYGSILLKHGDVAGALAAHRKAVALDPSDPAIFFNLGLALEVKGDLPGAIAAYRKALALDPTLSDARALLADVERRFARRGDARGHHELADSLYATGDWSGAADACRKALALDPRLVAAHNLLGMALLKGGDAPGAVAAFRKAAELEPGQALRHFNLGNALRASGDLAGAIAAHRQAVKLNPSSPQVHCNLGLELRDEGKFAEALVALRRGHELGSRRPGWKYPSARWVQECERLAELDKKLPAVLRGELKPRDAAEKLGYAEVCAYKRSFAAAARLYEEVFAGKPPAAADLLRAHRYRAARAAALGGAGQGEGDPPLGEAGRVRLRREALAWLGADLADWGKRLDRDPARARAGALEALRHWQRDPALAGLRDPAALAQLPEGERQSWRRFWAEVVVLVEKAQGKK
jgi:tetratricopeptide (TPR) repeat protein